MLTVTTQDGAEYRLALREQGQYGRVLVIARTGGADAAPIANKPMDEGRWYHVHVLDPLPPTIGAQLSMVLDPVFDDPDPVVRKTGMVTSVVGLLEPRQPPSPLPQPASPDPDDELDPVAPRPAASAVSARSEVWFFNEKNTLSKASGLFAAVVAVAVGLGRRR